ncbi:MAG: hypothetical protein J6W24_00195 [Prevotella sp.]|nr:hypothetical protein [Prevotella sp.]
MIDKNEITRHLQDWIDQMERSGKHVDLDDMNRHLGDIMHVQNAAPKPHFNRFSSEQMHLMLNRPLEVGCPVQLRRLTDEQMERIPVMRQALHLMTVLSEKDVKLTAQGYIPPKIVAELYELGSHSWSSDWYKQKSEPKTEEVQVLRVALKECGLIKTRVGKLSLTAMGKQLLGDYNELMRTIILFLFRDYNAGWLDLYEDNEVGNIGRLYSLWLLHHYGENWRNTAFYAEEYSKAFPMLNAGHVYEYRVFNRLFRFIGLCEINEGEEFKGKDWGREARKTELLDLMFAFDEPKSTYR